MPYENDFQSVKAFGKANSQCSQLMKPTYCCHILLQGVHLEVMCECRWQTACHVHAHRSHSTHTPYTGAQKVIELLELYVMPKQMCVANLISNCDSQDLARLFGTLITMFGCIHGDTVIPEFYARSKDKPSSSLSSNTNQIDRMVSHTSGVMYLSARSRTHTYAVRTHSQVRSPYTNIDRWIFIESNILFFFFFIFVDEA